MNNSLEKIAIIGANGFIGGHLSTRFPGARKYGRQNIGELKNDDSHLVIVAAAPATKWIANTNPEADTQNIEALVESLKPFEGKECVLISTIDVFPVGVEFDEESELPASHPEAYGQNRGNLERSIREIFPSSLVMRLPGMYGPGLKKNLIFDLVHGKEVSGINRESTFQFYDVRSLVGHIELARRLGLKIVNLATEPVVVADLYEECFLKVAPQADVPTVSYAMKTKLAYEMSGRRSDYIFSTAETLAGISEWIRHGNSS